MGKKFFAAGLLATAGFALFLTSSNVSAAISLPTPYEVGTWTGDYSGNTSVCVGSRNGYDLSETPIVADIRGNGGFSSQLVFNSNDTCYRFENIDGVEARFFAPAGIKDNLLVQTSSSTSGEDNFINITIDGNMSTNSYIWSASMLGQGIEASSTILQTGKNVNLALKRLIWPETETYEDTSSIKTLRFVDELPASIDPDTANKVNIAENGRTPVYAYADSNSNIYICSEAEIMMANADSSYMFYGMSYLTELEFSDSFDTSNVTDMSRMFKGVAQLTSLTLPDSFDTSSVTNMSEMFYSMTYLTELEFSDSFDTSNVTDMSRMFYALVKMSSLTFPDGFNTSNVIDMAEMFLAFGQQNTSASLVLPDSFDTSKVTNMYQMFAGTASLVSLSLPDSFDTSRVTNMSSMFGGMTSLTSLTLPNSFNTSNVTDMSWMFLGMGSEVLTSLTLPDNFVIEAGTNTSNIFKNIQSTATLCALDPTARSLWPGAIGCASTLQDGRSVNQAIKRLAGDGSETYTSGSAIESIRFVRELPDTIDPDSADKVNIAADGEEPVYAYVSDNDVYIYTEAKVIFANADSSDMFNYYYNVTTIELTNSFDTSHVTNMTEMFGHLRQLTSLTLPESFSTASVTDMSFMFVKMESLETLVLPDAFIIPSGCDTRSIFYGVPTTTATLTSSNADVQALWASSGGMF